MSPRNMRVGLLWVVFVFNKFRIVLRIKLCKSRINFKEIDKVGALNLGKATQQSSYI